MPKALFFNIPSSGHVNPSLPILDRLNDTDLEIIYINAEEIRPKIEALDTQFIAYPEFELFRTFFDHPPTDNFSSNALTLYRIAKTLLPFVIKLIEDEKPDIIIFDSLASWAKMGATTTNTPAIAFVSTFVITPDAMPSMPLSTVRMMIPQLLRALPPFIMEMWQIWRTYALRPLFIFDILMCLSEYNIVLTSRDLQPNGEKLSENFQFVGASLGERTTDADFPFHQLRDDVPKVYISLGTIARNNSFLKRCFIAFSEMPIQVILSVGKQTNITDLGKIPDNFIVRNYVPQLAVLDIVDVFVTHSGMNSVHESLIAGVPMIAIPQQPEQAMVATRLHDLGAGIGLQLTPPFGEVAPDELRQALQMILRDERYKEQAKQAGMSILQSGGAVRASDLIYQFATHGTFKNI